MKLPLPVIRHLSLVTLLILALHFCGCMLTGCRTKAVHVPVETVRTEYQEKWQRDSVYLRDSVLVYLKQDTVYIEKYRYLYKDKILRDSVFVNDTIRIPYPVLEIKEVNRLKDWQKSCIVLGIICSVLILGKVILSLKRLG